MISILAMKKTTLLQRIEWFIDRVDKIRTCDPTPPRRVRYQTALQPERLSFQITPIEYIKN